MVLMHSSLQRLIRDFFDGRSVSNLRPCFKTVTVAFDNSSELPARSLTIRRLTCPKEAQRTGGGVVKTVQEQS